MRNLCAVFALTLLSAGNLLGQAVEVEAQASPHAQMPAPIEWVVVQLPAPKTTSTAPKQKAKPQPQQAPELPGCRLLQYRPVPNVFFYQVEELQKAENWCESQKEQQRSNIQTFTSETDLLSWSKKKWGGFINNAAFQSAKTPTPKP
jgi:hypothetical protein